MKRMPRLGWLAIMLALAQTGCQTAPGRKIQDVVQDIQFKNRTRGEQQRGDAASVARELGCTSRSAPIVRLETHEVLPARPTPGREINHRFVYAACGVGTGLQGTLVRKVSSQGRDLFEDSEQFTLKPGRWAVDAFIGVPGQAQPGPYRIEVRFVGRSGFRGANDFTVVGR